MDDLFLNAFNALSGEEWDEKPVEIEEFVTDLCHLPPLSDYQYQMARAGTQIFKYETLVGLYGEEYAAKRYAQTCSECVFCLGKGSGKDFIATIICAYVVYLLLCLKNPQKYYGKPADNAIDILNVATNSDQAKNVFFKNLKTIIKNCEWFDGKYDPPTQNSISFDKSINLYSGHSEREAFEGLNLFLAVLDEISAFAHTENESPEATYNTYRDSVDSRFPNGFGKVLLLSFPRKKTGDFILDKYNEVVAEKEVIIRKRTLKLDPDLPDGISGNEFDVEWEEDHITKYTYQKIFALKRPSWEVNPTKTIEMYTRNFHANMANALAKFACMPTDGGEDAFFKNKAKIDSSFVLTNPVDENDVFLTTFTPKPDDKYFMHVDLSKVHDRCAVAMAHVDSWVNVTVGEHYSEVYPVVMVDALRWWQPSKGEPMNYKKVTDYILAVKKRGFNIALVTFDRWDSLDTMNFLADYHIKTDRLSVANKHYDDFLSVMYDGRLLGPAVPELIEELKQLQYVKDKVDHPRSGYKDLSDATCGSIFDAVANTIKPVNQEVEVLSYADLIKRNQPENPPLGVIRAPKRDMPEELHNYLSGMRLL